VSYLLDVNFLVACAWQSHADHARVMSLTCSSGSSGSSGDWSQAGFS